MKKLTIGPWDWLTRVFVTAYVRAPGFVAVTCEYMSFLPYGPCELPLLIVLYS